MLTEVEHAPAAGINGVEWDAVELPSQFMENWCYDEGTVYGAGMATHYETGEPLPRDLFDQLCAQRTYMAGSGMLRQLYFGVLDMELHHRYDPKGKESPFDVQKKIAAQYTVLPPLDDDRFLCALSHIFAGGYSAGYYSYKWAGCSRPTPPAFEVGLENEAVRGRAAASARPWWPSAAAATPRPSATPRPRPVARRAAQTLGAA